MNISGTLEKVHMKARRNKWLYLFAIFNRFALAAGFIPSGMVKILGERFTALATNHPMGNYLQAFYQTGFYYTVVGVMQVLAAVLLLFPRTAVLGAMIYFPIILNICILSVAVRFDGSLLTSPLMVMANLYLLGWYYHRWKFILPFKRYSVYSEIPKWRDLTNKFPLLFFTAVAVVVIVVGAAGLKAFDIKPRNGVPECNMQCEENINPKACYDFCECAHSGASWNACLEAYNKAKGNSEN